jgi:hypothetical protein
MGLGLGMHGKTAFLGYDHNEIGTIESDGRKRACTYTLIARWTDG